MDVPGQQSSYLALQTSLGRELLNYTLTTYTNGLVYPQKSSVIRTHTSHLTLEKQSQRNLGSSKIYPLPSTPKQMDCPNERINGWSNICTPSLPHTQKIGLTGLPSCQQCIIIRSTQQPAYHPTKSSSDILHALPHQKQSKWTMRQWRNE